MFVNQRCRSFFIDVFSWLPISSLNIDKLSIVDARVRITHRKNKDGGCTFYHNTLRIKRCGLTSVVPMLTTLLLLSLNDLQFLYALLSRSGRVGR